MHTVEVKRDPILIVRVLCVSSLSPHLLCICHMLAAHSKPTVIVVGTNWILSNYCLRLYKVPNIRQKCTFVMKAKVPIM